MGTLCMLNYPHHITVQGRHKMVPAQQFPPQQKGLYCSQIPHRNKLYFSLLSCSDFGILSCPTAAVSEKTRRVPTCLETIPHNLELEKMKTSWIWILVQVLCMVYLPLLSSLHCRRGQGLSITSEHFNEASKLQTPHRIYVTGEESLIWISSFLLRQN